MARLLFPLRALACLAAFALSIVDPLAFATPVRWARRALSGAALVGRLFFTAPSYTVDLLWRLGFKTREAILYRVSRDKHLSAAQGLTHPYEVRTFNWSAGVSFAPRC